MGFLKVSKIKVATNKKTTNEGFYQNEFVLRKEGGGWRKGERGGEARFLGKQRRR